MAEPCMWHPTVISKRLSGLLTQDMEKPRREKREKDMLLDEPHAERWKANTLLKGKRKNHHLFTSKDCLRAMGFTLSETYPHVV